MGSVPGWGIKVPQATWHDQKIYIYIIYILKVYILFDPGLGISLLGIDPEDIDAKPFIQVFSL